eukprot:CAMPEP_0113325022 /NCGR_PEP_ID=MMETSP0010_2-20120614/17458_1 /TAXON_ID=216773 ORGANISM="Corethron hystrix, Strain 308" /NCGR_SAMPLE_ID=MMETSP0010_2 /ASSEMBLY_ACC=CAM_ASM_000155 /LENGTH=37 /DNA_ID=CAMNT_0000184643 /DNA_START=271 /DNA_END=384 /DNA_ORIENTATION=- /assembly_acc=CAM_ASM_000155
MAATAISKADSSEMSPMSNKTVKEAFSADIVKAAGFV